MSTETKKGKAWDECKHYDREEIDFYCLLTRENIKLTQCKECKSWLERILFKSNYTIGDIAADEECS